MQGMSIIRNPGTSLYARDEYQHNAVGPIVVNVRSIGRYLLTLNFLTCVMLKTIYFHPSLRGVSLSTSFPEFPASLLPCLPLQRWWKLLRVLRGPNLRSKQCTGECSWAKMLCLARSNKASLLRPFLHQLELANPGSRSVFEVDAHNRFKRCIFVAPYAARFLRHGIPCIITDMAHFRKTKNLE